MKGSLDLDLEPLLPRERGCLGALERALLLPTELASLQKQAKKWVKAANACDNRKLIVSLDNKLVGGCI